MPYALCPMPYALCPVVPHLSEKGYSTAISRNAVNPLLVATNIPTNIRVNIAVLNESQNCINYNN